MNVSHCIYDNSEGWPAVNAVFQKSENIFEGVRYAAIPMQAVAEAHRPRPRGLPPAPDFVSHICDGGFEVVCGFDLEVSEGDLIPDFIHSGLGPLVNIFVARDEELLADEGGEDFDSWVAHCKYDNGERGASVNTNLKNNENILGVRFSQCIGTVHARDDLGQIRVALVTDGGRWGRPSRGEWAEYLANNSRPPPKIIFPAENNRK
jgi:hypothetical protein